MSKFFNCPVCGEEVKIGAKICPECGADDTSGWKEEYVQHDHVYDNLDLPDKDFDYDEFMRKEFGGDKKKSGKEWLVAAIALFIIIVWILIYIF